MANTLNLGTNGNWATKEGSLLAYNDENNNFKPLPFDFTRASSATVVNKQGLIETVGSGIPRIDFSDDAKGALLLEPTSTNLITYSEDFSDASWVKQNVNLTSNYEVSPDGTLNADRVITTNVGVDFYQSLTVIANTTYKLSFYVKLRDGEDIQARFYDESNWANISYVNYSSQLSDNQWKRVEIEVTTPLGCTSLRVWIVALTSTFIDVSYWGAQLEQNSYATSYIKTVGTAQTRVADTASDAGNSTVINSTEGVLYFEGSALADNGIDKRIAISDGTMSNYVSIGYSRFSGNITAELFSGGFIQTTDWGATGVTQTDNNKFAMSWGSGTMKFYFNGVQRQTASVTSPIGLNVLDFAAANGTLPMLSNTKDVRVYTTALSDAELISLTS